MRFSTSRQRVRKAKVVGLLILERPAIGHTDQGYPAASQIASGCRALVGHSSVFGPALAASVALQEEGGSADESRISGRTRCSDTIRSGSRASTCGPLFDKRS